MEAAHGPRLVFRGLHAWVVQEGSSTPRGGAYTQRGCCLHPAALVRTAGRGVRSLWALAAAPAGSAALGDTVGFGHGQAYRLASYAALVKMPGDPRSLVGFRSFFFSSLSLSRLARRAMSVPESTTPATARAVPLL